MKGQFHKVYCRHRKDMIFKLNVGSIVKSIVIFRKLFRDYDMYMKEKASKRRRPPPPNLFAWDSSTSKGGQKPVSVPSNKSKQR